MWCRIWELGVSTTPWSTKHSSSSTNAELNFRGRVESLDWDARLWPGCGAMGAGMMISNSEHERSGMRFLTRVHLGKMIFICNCSVMMMYANCRVIWIWVGVINWD